MSFKTDISKFVKKAGANQEKFVREFSFELSKQIVEATPVKTGFLMSSWSAVLNNPESAQGAGQSTNGNGNSAGGVALDRIGVSLLPAKAGDTVYIVNTANYGAFVEFGTSRQAGQAFVRNTLVRAQSIASDVLSRVRV